MGKIKAYKSNNKDYRLPLSPRIFRLSHSLRNDESAFTVAELVIVIVVIAVLAAITIVGYRGISKQTTESVMKGDLSNSYKALENFKTLNDTYPSTIDCSKSESSTNLCLENNSKDITFTYVPSSDLKTYQLCTTSANLKENYCVSNSKNIPTIAASLPTYCPIGFILVPGSSTYGTSDFCVMKYEAKADDDGDGVGDTTYNTGYNTWSDIDHPLSSSIQLVSTPEGYPVAGVFGFKAETEVSSYTENCSGCHLITEAEWMTIAQNVLSVASNWSSGTVGSGFIYNGHSYQYPSNALTASADDTDSNYGETSYNNSSVTSNNKRTLKLSNGQVIWDFSGNLEELTAGQTSTSPGVSGETAYTYHEWNAVARNNFSSLYMPSSMASGVLVNISNWTSYNGIGMVESYYGETDTEAFWRGGSYLYSDITYAGRCSGVLALDLRFSPYGANKEYEGLRVAAPLQ